MAPTFSRYLVDLAQQIVDILESCPLEVRIARYGLSRGVEGKEGEVVLLRDDGEETLSGVLSNLQCPTVHTP